MLDFSGMRNQNAQAKVHKTQKKMSELSDIHETRFSALMKGKVNPTLKEIDKLCKLWDCQVYNLVEFKEEK